MILGISRLGAAEGPETRRGFVEPGFFPQGVAERAPGLGVFGTEREGLAVALNGFDALAQFTERDPEIMVGLSGFGGKLNRPAVAGEGFVGPPLFLQGEAQVTMGLAEIRPGLDGLGHQPKRLFVLTPLMGDDAEQVIGIGIIGKRGEDLAIDLRRLVQAPGLMVPHGHAKSLIDRHFLGLSAGRVGGVPGPCA